MNIAIVGGRDFNDYKLMKKSVMDLCLTKRYNPSKVKAGQINERADLSVTIVSGGAVGADTLAEQFAKEFGFKTLIFKPDWEKNGKSAGFKRNKDIVNNADIIFAFWDENSKGTADTIKFATEQKKELHIIKYKKGSQIVEIMPFGKFKGQKLKDLNKNEKNYCQWVLDNFDNSSDIWGYMNKHKKTIANN